MVLMGAFSVGFFWHCLLGSAWQDAQTEAVSQRAAAQDRRGERGHETSWDAWRRHELQ